MPLQPREKVHSKKKYVCVMIDKLLMDIQIQLDDKRRPSDVTTPNCRVSDYNKLNVHKLLMEVSRLNQQIQQESQQLLKVVGQRNQLLAARKQHCDVITACIQALSNKTKEEAKMRFSLEPGETGFSQWLDAMKMVAQLPGGMPAEFRTKLWLQLSEKHLQDKEIDWKRTERIIFSEWSNPDDEELGVQIVKDLHRTGCSLFCGEEGEQNQALLKRVLLAYARWNKSVGYCQGFNMLAAIILQVMDRDEKNAVKVMIYLIDGVLPESYFANNLRGLSVDMAVFRDLMKLRLPKLSRHLEALQLDTSSGTGNSYEPPLTNVFTMQWFLTLFSNCLPQPTVLRVWDLVFLHGNEILLRTALAIWGILQDRVISVDSADEFYCIMGVVTRDMLEFGLMDANNLVKAIAMVDPFPTELQELREKYLYNITPWTQSVQSVARRGFRLFHSDNEEQDDAEDENTAKALAAAHGVFRRRESASKDVASMGPTLDIGILKKQYAKMLQRQRQAHVIITAACSGNMSSPSVSVNHLLAGKSALVGKSRRIGPPKGAVPPSAAHSRAGKRILGAKSDDTLQWKDAGSSGKQRTNHDRPDREVITETSVAESFVRKEHKRSSSSSSSSTELCDDDTHRFSSDFDSEDTSDGFSTSSPLKVSTGSPSFGRQLSASIREVEALTENIAKEDDSSALLTDVRLCALQLVDDIECRLQSCERLCHFDPPKLFSTPQQLDNTNLHSDNFCSLNSKSESLIMSPLTSKLEIAQGANSMRNVTDPTSPIQGVRYCSPVEVDLLDNSKMALRGLKSPDPMCHLSLNVSELVTPEKLITDDLNLEAPSIAGKSFVLKNNSPISEVPAAPSMISNDVTPVLTQSCSKSDTHNTSPLNSQSSVTDPDLLTESEEKVPRDHTNTLQKSLDSQANDDSCTDEIDKSLSEVMGAGRDAFHSCEMRKTPFENMTIGNDDRQDLRSVIYPEIEKSTTECLTWKREKNMEIESEYREEVACVALSPIERMSYTTKESTERKDSEETGSNIIKELRKELTPQRSPLRNSLTCKDAVSTGHERKTIGIDSNTESGNINFSELVVMDNTTFLLPIYNIARSEMNEQTQDVPLPDSLIKKSLVYEDTILSGNRGTNDMFAYCSESEEISKTSPAHVDGGMDHLSPDYSKGSVRNEQKPDAAFHHSSIDLLSPARSKPERPADIILPVEISDSEREIRDAVGEIVKLKIRLNEISSKSKTIQEDLSKLEKGKTNILIDTKVQSQTEKEFKMPAVHEGKKRWDPADDKKCDQELDLNLRAALHQEIERDKSSRSYLKKLELTNIPVSTEVEGKVFHRSPRERSYRYDPDTSIKYEQCDLPAVLLALDEEISANESSQPYLRTLKSDTAAQNRVIRFDMSQLDLEGDSLKTKCGETSAYSKSEWEAKMKKIAELDSITRAKLSEIKYDKRDRHRGRSVSPRLTRLNMASSTDKKLRVSALSFDEITCRTEKLLRQSAYSTPDRSLTGSQASIRSSRDDFEKELSLETFLLTENPKEPVSPPCVKPKDTTSKFKQLIEECYGSSNETSEDSLPMPTKKYQAFSSPTSPTFQFRPKIKYSEYVSPRRVYTKPQLKHSLWELEKNDEILTCYPDNFDNKNRSASGRFTRTPSPRYTENNSTFHDSSHLSDLETEMSGKLLVKNSQSNNNAVNCSESRSLPHDWSPAKPHNQATPLTQPLNDSVSSSDRWTASKLTTKSQMSALHTSFSDTKSSDWPLQTNSEHFTVSPQRNRQSLRSPDTVFPSRRSPISPFPSRSSQKPKDITIKLGLYPSSSKM